MIRRMVCSLGVMAVVLAATGCGAFGGDGGEPDSLSSLLERVPNTADNRMSLVYGNLARLRGEAGPAKDGKSEVKALMDKSKGTFVLAEPAQTNILRDGFTKESGFALMDIDASVQAGQPPNSVSLFAGRFDPAKVETALTKNAPFANDTKTGEHAGVKTFSVGSDGKLDVRKQSPLRPVGNALRIGVTEERIWLTSKDQLLNNALDVSDGEGTSLADDERYESVANAIDEAKAFNAVLIGDPRSFTVDAAGMAGRRTTPELAERFQKLIDEGKMGLAPWQVAGVADVPGELLVVLAHADEAGAKQNAERLRAVVQGGVSSMDGQDWSERLSVGTMDLKGSLLIAHLKTERPMAFRLVTSRDNLILIAKK